MRSVLLLRGINVGGHGKLPMADLRAAIEATGGEDAKTYIQSGNAVFRGTVDADALRDAIKERAGFRPQLMLLTEDTFRMIVANNPYSDATVDHKAMHVGFIAASAHCTDAELIAAKGSEERVSLTDAAVYLHTPKYLSGSTIAPKLEKLLGVPTTMRNWRTVEALSDMLEKLT